MTPTSRTAALIALALGWPLAHAQAPAKPATPPAAASTKSLGSGQASGKLMTREELRACLKTQTELRSRRPELERERAELDREKGELQQAGEAIRVERESFASGRSETVAAFNAKAAAHGERINALNARAATLAELEKQRNKRDEAQRLRQELEAERQELLRNEEALKLEAATVNRMNADTTNEFNARAAAHDQKVQAWNERNRAAAERAGAWQADNERWNGECANRRYLEDDEIAIQRGK
jgi:chromosome segregation ATPase